MKHTLTKGNAIIAFFLACLTIILLVTTERAIGLTTDETTYFAGSESFARWLWVLAKDPARALNPSIIEETWSVSDSHPPVAEIWSGVVWMATKHILPDMLAHRLGTILLVALLVALLYLMVAGTYGKAAGLFTTASLLSMPRFFFHAHLMALDVPVAVASFVLTFVFWKTVDRKGWAWGLLWGLAWGLAVSVKLNAVFVPLAIVLWLIFFRRKWSLVLRLFLMGIIAVLTFFLAWPWLYYQTWERVMGYVNFHIHHYGIGQWYLGQFYMPPPWSYVFVTLWAVMPLTVTILSLAGMARAGKGKRDSGLGWLLILSALTSISPFILGKSLVYNGERLFMPVFPFLAALSGIGFGWLVAFLKKNGGKGKAIVVSRSIGFTPRHCHARAAVHYHGRSLPSPALVLF